MATDIETLQAAVDAVNRGDIDALRRVTDPEFEFVPLRTPLTGSYHGHDGAARFLRDNAEMFEIWVAEFPDVRRVDDGRLLAIGSVRIKPQHGGPETTVTAAAVAVISDGLLRRWDTYGTLADALAAIGKD